jgi:hypothetical protein
MRPGRDAEPSPPSSASWPVKRVNPTYKTKSNVTALYIAHLFLNGEGNEERFRTEKQQAFNEFNERNIRVFGLFSVSVLLKELHVPITMVRAHETLMCDTTSAA